MKISRVGEMRKLDKTAVQDFSIPEELLMENAGLAACSVIHREIGTRGNKFLIFCGIGNNGGDGLMVARKLHSMGAVVKIFLLGDPGKFKGAAKANFNIISKIPVPREILVTTKKLKTEIAQTDILIDAIFGTGLTREVEGLFKKVIELINSSGKPVFSLDIPSGTNGDTGQIMGAGVEADFTITFGLPKLGNTLYPGFGLCGKLFVTHISFPPEIYQNENFKIEISTPNPLDIRQPDGHKGSFGDVLFISGAANYYGAPYLSAGSFLKAGGGYSRLAAPKSAVPFIASKGAEIVFAPMEETESGSIALSNADNLLQLSQQVDMVVIGPGLSLDKETQRLTREIVKSVEKPLLLDGDGITAVCDSLEVVAARKFPTILTPHPGEMSRIADVSIAEVSMSQIDILQEQAETLNALIVLKGANSLIGYPDRQVFINMSGNSGMASAGSGDVLTGTISAMFGLGLDIREAARTGVFIHGFAGDLAAAEKGEDGITAQDILDNLPDAVRFYRNSYSDIVADAYQSIFSV